MYDDGWIGCVIGLLFLVNCVVCSSVIFFICLIVGEFMLEENWEFWNMVKFFLRLSWN